MGAGGAMMTLVVVITAGITAYLIGTTIRSIRNEHRTHMSLWKNFGLSLGFCALFLISWVGHAITQWQVYTDEQRSHNESVEFGDFVAEFSQATLENWQSEFLQLFSFTVMAAVLIHKGSSESRDSGDLIMASLKRIEDQMGTEPTLRTEPLRQDKDLHVVPDEAQGWILKDGANADPEGYFDLQEEAIDAGRELAARRSVNLVIHSPDGTPRDPQ
jgi:hypothetical protein